MDEKPKMVFQAPISLSKFTRALIFSLQAIKPKSRPDDFSKISVSQTVSFIALAYERLRNVMEFREEHLVLRAAIERIFKRRLALNPQGKDESENLIRELLWARYFGNESLGSEDVRRVQDIIDRYVALRQLLTPGRNSDLQQYLAQFILDLTTCEIEEYLKPEGTTKSATWTFFIYQVLRKKIRLQGLSEEQKDAFFLAAIEKSYRKSDKAYQRYHLFITFYKKLSDYDKQALEDLATHLPETFKKIDAIVLSPYVDSLSRYVKKQMSPFLILFDITQRKLKEVERILTEKKRLWSEVEYTCREKYQQLGTRLRNLAIRSFIYIFLTKMILAIILEYPASLYIYGEVNYIAIAINSIFPAILMAVIVLLFRLPGEDNTKNIYQRIIEITDADPTFETQVAYIPKKTRIKKPILIFGFTIFYTFTFFITLLLIHEALKLLKFNLISEAIFIFFVSVVTFFSYRIKQIVNEYQLKEKQGILTPVIDFFFMPILSLGKFFSSEIAKLNFFIFIFDFLIEAPFKYIFEIVEEWISFVKQRKEEII